MEVKNRKIYHDFTFEQYQALPGISHSDIRMDGRAPFKPTAKMNLGTAVHQYLCSPAEYNHDNIKVVKPIALALKDAVGGLWQHLSHEVSVNAEFHEQGFMMLYRGRIDSGILDKVIIDYKIINGDSVKGTMDHFNYPTQLSGYGLGYGASTAFIIAYSNKTKKTEIVYVPVKNEWWREQVITRGNPII